MRNACNSGSPEWKINKIKQNEQIMVNSVPWISESCFAILKVKAFVLTSEKNNRVMQLHAFCLAHESVLNIKPSVKA